MDSTPRHPENSLVEMIQSLVVAFVLAMTFRGFVTEGFVIPTGSMAPTLLGRHKSLHTPFTGYRFDVGVDDNGQLAEVPDPMLGVMYPGTGSATTRLPTRMGDRILVHKGLYPFAEPDRYDVVVFKNPTHPTGDDGNYIKRLVGLPNESIWFVDGDVFAAPIDATEDLDAYTIQRKPEHVQRAVWQHVHDSDFVPLDPEAIDQSYFGPPWTMQRFERSADGNYRSEDAGSALLEWDSHRLLITDWTPYNALMQREQRRSTRSPLFAVNDIRVRATVLPASPGLSVSYKMVTLRGIYEFTLVGEQARIRWLDSAYGEGFGEEGWQVFAEGEITSIEAGRPTNLEFWHVDQSVAIYVDGERVAYGEYDWRPPERLRRNLGKDLPVAELARKRSGAPMAIRLAFDGSPVIVNRLRVDRDIFYRPGLLDHQATRNPTNERFSSIVRPGAAARGTHPSNVAELGPDHFFMCGDNSSASLDSRLWGNPHPVVARQIDPAPFIVHRKLLMGKAWLVYFPSPLPLKDRGRAVIPNFGRLRFIR